jgi:hypothetical protein
MKTETSRTLFYKVGVLFIYLFMRLKNAGHFKKIGLLVATMFLNMGAEAQVKNFEYAYGNSFNRFERSPMKVLKDKSIITATAWSDRGIVNLQGSCIHKLSSDGKLVWRTILECGNAVSHPVSVDELGGGVGSVVCLLDVFSTGGSGFQTNQLVILNSSGALVKNIGYTSKSIFCNGVSVVTRKNSIYAISNEGSGSGQTIVQKFDNDLKQIASVTIEGLNSSDAIMNNDNLLIVGNNSGLGATLFTLDTNLSIKYAKHYEITDPVIVPFSAYDAKIEVDNGKPIIFGYLNAGTAQQYYIYPNELSASRLIYGDNNNSVIINDNNLYMVGKKESTDDAYIVKYDPKTGKKKWTNIFGGEDIDYFYDVAVVDNATYSLGATFSYPGSFGAQTYIVQADTNGKSTCSKDTILSDIIIADIKVVESVFPYTTSKIDTPFVNVVKVISTSDYFDSLACKSSSTSSIQHLSGTTDIEVYPTVTSGIVNLNHVDVLKGSSFELVNINGQLMITGKLKNVNNSIDVSNLSDGFYVLRVIDEKTKAYSTFKIVKQSN